MQAIHTIIFTTEFCFLIVIKIIKNETDNHYLQSLEKQRNTIRIEDVSVRDAVCSFWYTRHIHSLVGWSIIALDAIYNTHTMLCYFTISPSVFCVRAHLLTYTLTHTHTNTFKSLILFSSIFSV